MLRFHRSFATSLAEILISDMVGYLPRKDSGIMFPSREMLSSTAL